MCVHQSARRDPCRRADSRHHPTTIPKVGPGQLQDGIRQDRPNQPPVANIDHMTGANNQDIPAEHQHAYDLLTSGHTYAAAAEKIGVTDRTLRVWAAKHGWQNDINQARSETERYRAAARRDSAARLLAEEGDKLVSLIAETRDKLAEAIRIIEPEDIAANPRLLQVVANVFGIGVDKHHVIAGKPTEIIGHRDLDQLRAELGSEVVDNVVEMFRDQQTG